MPEPVGEDRNLKFVFHRAADFRMVAVNSVWGGPTPRGEILVEFAVETLEDPETVTNVVRADGTLGAELSRSPKERIIRREIQVGMILTIEHAESIGQFLLGKVAEVKQLRQDDKSGEK